MNLEGVPSEIGSRFKKSEDALAFMFAGHAHFTLRSKKTGTRYTYRVSKAKDSETVFFAALLVGSDNTKNYGYLGVIQDRKFRLTKKSRMAETASPVVALKWTLNNLINHSLPEQLEFWHEGRCGRCGRMLTVPESLELGVGPECASIQLANGKGRPGRKFRLEVEQKDAA